jgi:hypothetical protein
VQRLDGQDGSIVPLDVRDPFQIKPYGHATWGVSEVWDSHWMPVYNKLGVATGKRTNLGYSVDPVRGLDAYAVDLPGGTEPPVSAAAPPCGSSPSGTARRVAGGGGLPARLRGCGGAPG